LSAGLSGSLAKLTRSRGPCQGEKACYTDGPAISYSKNCSDFLCSVDHVVDDIQKRGAVLRFVRFRLCRTTWEEFLSSSSERGAESGEKSILQSECHGGNTHQHFNQ
jgi:hypothetical protein